VRLLEESLIVNCPNPKCQRQFKESILLTINSVTPPKQYNACPYCFANLETEPQIGQTTNPEKIVEQKADPESIINEDEVIQTEEDDESFDYSSDNKVLEREKDSAPSFFKKVKALIPGSNGSKKNNKQKTEKPEAEPELVIKKEDTQKDKLELDLPVKKEEPKLPTSSKTEESSSICPATFGYLANRPKDESIPQICFVCPKMVDCMLSPRDN
jgi:hypothetical protein